MATTGVQCYAFNGRPSPFDGKMQIPCNLTAVNEGGHSTCCAVGDLCLTNGMCKNPLDPPENNWFWRNGCTDKTWSDPACPRLCENVEPTRNSSLIFNCLKTRSWCCGYRGGRVSDWPAQSQLNTTCCGIEDLAFLADDPVVYATATWSNQLFSTTTTSQATARSTILISTSSSTNDALISSRTESSSSPSDLVTTPSTAAQSDIEMNGSQSGGSDTIPIGLGVGIPVGALLVAGIGFYFWKRNRRSRRHYVPAEPVEMGTSRYAYEVGPTNVPLELSSHNMAELPTISKR